MHKAPQMTRHCEGDNGGLQRLQTVESQENKLTTTANAAQPVNFITKANNRIHVNVDVCNVA
jgi:hypothetical protein